ncbi:hypothetical protein K505DRAFT_307429 [Melanomma pulvis-pyrius CBS 109.77]|uniref:F-box domain-containing protein n=1 Tax=Melanomma pulvis-pyrius CBS 109.77 TaxID=1314802 RepID=A0A6A6X8F9_9PLEO|nr:hypothetical protein K505DRAFT_307429 [Melanomma pulvis-pyrius CBS 109.77]
METLDVIPDIVQAFRQCQTNRSRAEALEALTAELTPAEWRALSAKLNGRDFRFDIVGALPVELVASIFAHVDVGALFRLQCVSKCWRSLLCSPDVLYEILQAWDGTTTYRRGDYALCQRKARDIHRFRIGVYEDYTTFEGRTPGFRFDNLVDALVKDTFIWLENGSRTLNVYDLRNRTGIKKRQLYGDGHERILIVALSEELIAFATSFNTCHVMKLDGSHRTKFKLAPGMFQQLACRSRTVVCGGFVNDSAVIYLWDFDTQKGTSCVDPRTLAILPDPHTQTITVFASDRCHKGVNLLKCKHTESACSIDYSRFSFNGERIQDGTLCLSGLSGLSLRGFRPAGYQGQFALLALKPAPQIFDLVTISFQFDEQLHEFTNPNCPKLSSCMWVKENISWWNDTFFQAQFMDRDIDALGGIYLAHIGTSGAYNVTPQIEYRVPRHGGLVTSLFVNDKFAVLMSSKEIAEGTCHVLSYEEPIFHSKDP